MYKMKSDINFSLTHEMLENAENERIHTSYAQEKAILECVSNGDIHALENLKVILFLFLRDTLV